MDKTATSDMAEAPLNDLLQLSLQAAITAGQVIMKITTPVILISQPKGTKVR